MGLELRARREEQAQGRRPGVQASEILHDLGLTKGLGKLIGRVLVVSHPTSDPDLLLRFFRLVMERGRWRIEEMGNIEKKDWESEKVEDTHGNLINPNLQMQKLRSHDLSHLAISHHCITMKR
jgi:hypothetical protein